MIKKISYTLIICAAPILFILLTTNLLIAHYGRFSSSRLQDVPPAYAALLLGTSKWQSAGVANLYYNYRIDAAVRLYMAGKVKKIIVSGSNMTIHYNEPRNMRADLIVKGVPTGDIISDYAGLRTLDSVIRFHKIFEQKRGIVVSQKFHNSRAIYIARKHGITLYGYNAQDVPFHYGIKVMMREIIARCVCFFDVNILCTEPHHLGAKIPIDVP